MKTAMNGKTYNAPWGTALLVVTSLCVAAGLFVNVLPFFARAAVHQPLALAGLGIIVILLVTMLFVVRSYTIEPDALAIRRLLWTTRVPLAGLQSATFTPDVMRRSLRLFGNGGMFSITGWYRNSALGTYRAFVTDLKNTVVLRFATQKTIVVSPENPEAFAAELSNRKS
jgi:hypothetical protein